MTRSSKLLSLSALFVLLLNTSCTQNESVANDSGVNFVRKDNANAAVLAKFDGKEIIADDLEKNSPEVYEARTRVYLEQKRAIEEQVRNLVIDSLAKKAKLSTEEFMKKETEIAKKKIANKDVDAFLKKNNVADLSKVPENIRDQVRGLLHMQGLVAAATRNNKVELYLKRPKLSNPVSFKTEGEASWGDDKSAVTIVEFSDFQCPYCAQAKDMINNIKKQYGKKIRVVFKNFPLPPHMHPEARIAAEAAMCVNEQGSEKFWKFHDVLFENQSKLQEADLKEYAKKIGADRKKFDECLSAKKFAAHIDAGMEEARVNGINSTPTFYINGQPMRGAREADFKEVIDEALGK